MNTKILLAFSLCLILLIGCTSDSKTLKINPKSYDFGTVGIGEYLEQDFVLTNQFNDVLTVSVLKIDGSTEYQIVSNSSVPIEIPAKGTHTVTIRFTPTTDGLQDATLTIMHSETTKEIYISITGVGQKVARIDVPVRSHDFNVTVNNIGKTHDFEIFNIGTSEMTLDAFTFVGPNSGLFSISNGGNVPIQVSPGYSHIITVQFLPIVSGKYSATLQISHNAVNDDNPLDITLDGEGVDVNPMISLSVGTSWDFGSVATILSSIQDCVIENIGTDPLTVNNATLQTSTDFTVNSLKDDNGNVISFPQQIPVGNKIHLYVEFTPSATITYNDVMQISHDGTNQSPLWDVPVSGMGRTAQQKTWDVVTKTKESWTIPTNITSIRIEVWGAQGGGIGYGTPGKGARMRGDFNVNPGDVLELAVGEQGQTGGQGGGGGGGSFVVFNGQPMIIAGGGGGSHYNNQGLDGKDGVTTQTCTPHASTGTGYTGGSGGGWYGDGAAGDYGAQGGKGWTSGLTGGAMNTQLSYHWSNGNGGYGGGGGGCWAPGSAGGYNGGVSATSYGNQTPGGTGGGSINNGANQDNSPGVQTSNGKIIITY